MVLQMLDSSKLKSTLSLVTKRFEELSQKLEMLEREHKERSISNPFMQQDALDSIYTRINAISRNAKDLARQISASIEHKDLSQDEKFELQVILTVLEDDLARGAFEMRRCQLLMGSIHQQAIQSSK